MSKSILVIDTPENCDDCRLMHSYYDHDYGWIKNCIGSGVNDCSVFGRKLEDHCPLKHLPKELEPGISEEYVNYCQGFNDCINEILGGKDE